MAEYIIYHLIIMNNTLFYMSS